MCAWLRKSPGREMESLAGPASRKRMVWPLPRRPQAQPPRLDVYAAIPEAGLGGGDGDVHGAGDVEADEFVTRGRVGHVHRLAVHRDGEGGGAHLGGTGAACTREAAWAAAGSARTATSKRRRDKRSTPRRGGAIETNVAGGTQARNVRSTFRRRERPGTEPGCRSSLASINIPRGSAGEPALGVRIAPQAL